MTTLADLLAARGQDNHPALLFEGGRCSYSELVAAGRVRAAAAETLRQPDRPFHLGVLLDNVPEFLFWVGGAAFAGATVVGINPTRRGGELAADIRHTDCQLIVTDADHLSMLEGLDLGLDINERVLMTDSDRYRAFLEEHRDIESTGEPNEKDILLLLFTSGSTGAPKAVVCSQGRLARIAATSSALFGIERDDVLYESMPLFHGNAIMANWLPALGAGATVALRRKFSASGFLSDVRQYQATYFNYVGRALAYILATPPTRHDRDHQLRLGFGTEASAQDMARFSERFGCRIIEGYGSSEGVISIRRLPDTPPTALGLPADPSMDVVIADPGTGQECPRARFDEHGRLLNGDEAIGEIVNRTGAPAFEGYYRNEDAMATRLREGWYWSGDLGYRDADGWFYFAGRSSDWLRVDSENFAAAPIERILARYPGVVMVAVYPVPDARTGDQVMAALELETGKGFSPEQFLQFLEAQPDLGTKWAPRYVRIVTSMPLTGTNKVNKQPLRDRALNPSDGPSRDPIFWRAQPSGPYRRLEDTDVTALRAEFAAHGRTQFFPDPEE